MLLKILLILVIVFELSSVFADGPSGEQGISEIYQRSGDGNIYIVGDLGPWSNPDDCNSSNKLIIEGGNPFRKDFLSTALAIQMSGRKMSAWLTGCSESNGVTSPTIWGIYSK